MNVMIENYIPYTLMCVKVIKVHIVSFYFLEHDAAPNGLKCETCNSPIDFKCNTLLSCVGIQDCCIKGALI